MLSQQIIQKKLQPIAARNACEILGHVPGEKAGVHGEIVALHMNPFELQRFVDQLPREVQVVEMQRTKGWALLFLPAS